MFPPTREESVESRGDVVVARQSASTPGNAAASTKLLVARHPLATTQDSGSAHDWPALTGSADGSRFVTTGKAVERECDVAHAASQRNAARRAE